MPEKFYLVIPAKAGIQDHFNSGTLDMLVQFTKENEYLFLPESHNAFLDGISFRTASLEGHETLNKIQVKRAEESGWGKYPHAESRSVLVEKILHKK